MFWAYPRPRYQVSVYRTIGPLAIYHYDSNPSVSSFLLMLGANFELLLYGCNS